jgi:predicted Zn-dependent protease with MMP-like domain
VPLAGVHPARRDARARIVLYRRPIEARAIDELDKADLVLDVVIHEVADLLGLTPEVIDPEGHGEPDDD